MIQLCEAHAKGNRHLSGMWPQPRSARQPQHDRSDRISGTCRKVVELAENRIRGSIDSELLVQFATCRLPWSLAGVDPATGQGELPRVGAQRLRGGRGASGELCDALEERVS